MPVASEVMNNFEEWRDKADDRPVEITEHGKTTAYLISPALLHSLLASYRRAVLVEDLTEGEIGSISRSRITVGEPYGLDDLPDVTAPIVRSR